MKEKNSGAGGGRKGFRWGVLMSGAFFAGLLAVGVALLLPGQTKREQSPVSPVPPPPPAAVTGPLPAGPALPRLAIVVDDLGYEPSRDAEWLTFPEKITVAVIPFGPSSRKIAESARDRGWGVILHVPMEPEKPASDRTERFRLRRGMTREEMEALLARMLEDLPQAKGASNHMGSAFTADPAAMENYVSILAKRRLYLLDSVTTPGTVAVETALRAGIPAARRDVFLDADMNPDEMALQWDKAIAIAREKGSAVLICHGRAETLRTILGLLPGLRRDKVEAVLLEDILQGKGA